MNELNDDHYGRAKEDEPGEVECSLSGGAHFRSAKDANGERGVTEYWFWEGEFLDWDAEFNVQYESIGKFEASETGETGLKVRAEANWRRRKEVKTSKNDPNFA